MSELRTDTITASDGTSPVTLTKQEALKSWVNFNGTGTIAARDSLNFSSLTDNGTGDYTVTISNAFSAVNYAIFGNAGAGATHAAVVMSPYAISTQTTSAMRSRNFGSASTLQDQDLQSTGLIGDLA